MEDSVSRNGYQPIEKSTNFGSETAEKEESTEDAVVDEQTQAFDFLNNLDIKVS